MPPKNPLRDLTPTEADLTDDPSSTSTSASPPRSGETLREKATKKLHGPDANPSQLGDPVSLKAETTDHVPAPSEEGARGQEDKTKGKSRL
ncbi:hypothetical protein M406DRAFT_324214 [Cryphonectria parasitica EP155]|uniref:Uncharacterized protein n=1 Tax=Cryphonectria parasitica (strain ATCC 38755 / EP155) TaxID=660469 RepID=A0A9P4XUT9_CRYP1|nr:uncharacterized protein M406DRAFT_324214 [Cryphonectria parasitica EP155]KAF3761692.1 hypothetical protein M406DRAFT_324214 [Cryphonectria parasitica EP155]